MRATAVFIFGMAMGASVACAAVTTEPGTENTLAPEAATTASAHGGLVELLRQNSERGTAGESTKTTLRMEVNLSGVVSRLRLDLQFPDDKTDFQGQPFQPQLGDIKLRAYFQRIQLGSLWTLPDIELTFPTADPASLGGGKYQVSAALHSVPGNPLWTLHSGRHKIHFEWDVRQTVSVAGDPNRKDVNTTKPEIALRDVIAPLYWLKVSLKPTIDWTQGGKSGAVAELEGGWNASHLWRFSLMGGAGAWGQGVPGTYNRRIELTALRRF